jgi:hypothetical protein
MVQEERMIWKRRREGGKEGRGGEEKENEIEKMKNVAQRTFWTATSQFSYDADV